MIENPRFWLAIILYFAAASLSAGIRGALKKRSPLWLNLYLVLAVSASIGLWVFAGTEPYSFKEAFNLVNLFCVLFGVLTGQVVYFLPFLVILFILFSQVYKLPLASLRPMKSRVVGELFFYPSNDDSVTIGWITGEKEEVISLKGDKAGLLFVKNVMPAQYFFLENTIYPLAILSEVHPISDLSQADPDWYYPLATGKERVSSLYQSTYPAVKYYSNGFFTRYLYSIEEDRIVIVRK